MLHFAYTVSLLIFHVHIHIRNRQMSRSVAARVFPNRPGSGSTEFPSNKVQTAYPSLLVFIPISVLRQYAKPLSLYFLIICALAFVKEVSPFDPMSQLIPVVVVLSVSVFREIVQEKNRQEEDRRVNCQVTRVNKQGNWVETSWEKVQVGDVILIPSDAPCPADIVMVASSTAGNTTYIQTTSLDGESNYKPRFGLDKAVVTLNMMISPDLPEGQSVRPELIVHAEAPRSDLDWFSGEAVFHLSEAVEVDMREVDPPDPLSPLSVTKPSGFFHSISPQKSERAHQASISMQPIEVCQLSVKNFIPREAVVRGSEWVIGVVVYTGKDTKVLLGQQKPSYKVSKIDRITNQLVLLIMFFQVSIASLMVLGTFMSSHQPRWWLNATPDGRSAIPVWGVAALSFFSCILLITCMIPISLVVSLEIAKVFQAKFITQDSHMPGAATPSQALNDDLGQIGYILSDKTGTITSNELQLKKITVNGVSYDSLAQARSVAAATTPLLKVGSNSPLAVSSLLTAPPSDPDQPKLVSLFIDALSVCHDVAPNWSADLGSSAAIQSKNIGDMKLVSIQERAVRSGTSTPGDGTIQPTLPTGMSYCGESPDEICLVSACATEFGRTLTKRSQSYMVVVDSTTNESKKWPVIRFNAFNNARRRSSVIVQSSLADGEGVFHVFVKGSDDAVIPQCLFPLPEDRAKLETTQTMINTYAKQSLRTLVVGFKTITRAELAKLDSEFGSDRNRLIDEIESGLTLLGCTGTEDRLQDGVEGSIQRLRIAGIAVWMITGDKLDTAVEISKSANLISKDMETVLVDIPENAPGGSGGWLNVKEREAALGRLEAALTSSDKVAAVVTGRSIRHMVLNNDAVKDRRFVECLLACKSVVVCRSTKDQKAQMVALIQQVVRSEVLVLAIGDGANDVPMIKRADVGVGIAGKEGRQAAQNADYVITQFKHLERLLLVHGRLNYVRTSKMVLYFLFKNLVLTLPFALHSVLSCLFSSSVLVTNSVSMSFNTVLTAFPVFAIGLMERDVSPNDHLVGVGSISATALAQSYPKLYMTGRMNRMFTRRLLGTVFVGAVLIGTWIYMTCLLPIAASTSANANGLVLDHWSVSTVYFVGVFVVDTAAAVLISEGVTMPLIVTITYSVVVCLTFLVSDSLDAANPGGAALFELLNHTLLWIPILLLACLPPIFVGLAVKAWKYRFNPTARMVWQQAKHRADRRRELVHKLDRTSSMKKREALAQKNSSILQQKASFYYHPDQLLVPIAEETRPLLKGDDGGE